MDASGANLDTNRGSSASTSTSNHQHHHSRSYNGIDHFSASNFFYSPLSPFLEYADTLQTRSSTYSESADCLINSGNTQNDTSGAGDNSGEVSIRIIGLGEQQHDWDGGGGMAKQNVTFDHPISRTVSSEALDTRGDSWTDHDTNIEGILHSVNGDADMGAADGAGVNNSRDSAYQRYDIQQAALWVEHVLPFSLLLMVVFIWQHLEGFLVTIWITAVMFKSNDILQKQRALKGEVKRSVLMSISLLFTLHVVGIYWWYRKDDILYPLLMAPPKTIPPFWNAIFIILVNDTSIRQAAMVLKCFILIYYKNSRGQDHRKQGQMLTLVEYLLLLYRALLPVPVWYQFFLNKEYGGLFSSLMTGLYLTFKLTSVVEKVQSFFSALTALSRKEINYGACATSEQVSAAGDLCVICQEKMHAPILLRCKHIFCEDCVSEWFERERTCPLCRAMVKPADIRSFSDGSTCLFFQLF